MASLPSFGELPSPSVRVRSIVCALIYMLPPLVRLEVLVACAVDSELTILIAIAILAAAIELGRDTTLIVWSAFDCNVIEPVALIVPSTITVAVVLTIPTATPRQ